MSQDVHETAAELATDFEQSETVAIERSAVVKELKRRLDVATIDHDAVRAGFEDAGWTYGRHLYFAADAVTDRVHGVVDELRSEGRLLVTHDEVCDRVVDDEQQPRDDIKGWSRGPFAETVADAFAETAWRVDALERDGTSRRVYTLPLYAVFERNHPRGERPLSRSELFSHYLAVSVDDAIDG